MESVDLGGADALRLLRARRAQRLLPGPRWQDTGLIFAFACLMLSKAIKRFAGA
jgi:hypothetical protein